MAVVIEQPNLRRAVGPGELYTTPIHRWFVFPHSFSVFLVNCILDRLTANPGQTVLDPCLGAGTTLVACRTRGISAMGTDILPLAVIVGKAKTHGYHISEIEEVFHNLNTELRQLSPVPRHTDIMLLQRAFPLTAFSRAIQIREQIHRIANTKLRPFFLTALVRCFSKFGAIRRDGGWPRLTDRTELEPERVDEAFHTSVGEMIEDVRQEPEYFRQKPGRWSASFGDMRVLKGSPIVDYVITSPPYLNKHDYTRLFTPELSLLGISSNNELIALRYKTIRSHVEARRPLNTLQIPSIEKLNGVIDALSSYSSYGRKLSYMVTGYFEDLLAFLRACSRTLRSAGYVCLVISNVQYFGIQVPVDDIIVSLAHEANFEFEEQWILRYRGNSSQQMAKFERKLSRESVLFLRKKDGV